MAFPIHPFRTPRLSGPQAGWFRPAAAVIIALALPSVLAMLIVAQGQMVFSGPPKDASGYTLVDHISIVVGALSISFLVSWMMAPFALLVLRLALMTGWAGWGSAILAAVFMGLPVVHVALMGDVTSEDNAILPHITVGIAILGLCVWAAYWALFSLSKKPEISG